VQKPHPYRTGTVIGRRRVGAMERRPGRSAEAKALLQPVYDRFTEGFGTTDLKAPQALLDALAEPYAPRTRTSRPNATSGMAGAGYFAYRTAPNSRRPVHPGGQVARGSPLEQNQ
jgi:hypothetical protein